MNDSNPMYLLGQLARAVFPDGDIPDTILTPLLTRPATGLALLAQSHAEKSANQDEINAIIKRLSPDLKSPNVSIKTEEQSPFWRGFYYYSDALIDTRKHDEDDLAKAGITLYRDRW
ncbi:hypothetical protein O5O45_05815 [Hahella aquimaris]|uniref:hypothetical protein n=1 Tax=Hahella sp. HNIBRBA332 TaxID=3015983 RepID=UPI00273BDD37|nr:hypothetical protein [Hahella sp. HNIBRBA332]WLQ15435.1 hypothetical protein O5O45_05815 [Hahella sp. HNIBRBA332]